MKFLLIALLSFQLCAVEFVCEEDKQAYEYICNWAISDEALRIKQEKNIASDNPALNQFLRDLVLHPVMSEVLKQRPYFDYSAQFSYREMQAIYFDWQKKFIDALTFFGGHLLPNPSSEWPETVAFLFDLFPGFIIKMRAKNSYRLGFYDSSGMFTFSDQSSMVSQIEFPLQEVSRLLYSEEVASVIAEKGYTAVHAPKKRLFIFPGYENAPLNDESIFVVAERVVFDENKHAECFGLMKAAYCRFIEDETSENQDPYKQLLNNFFEVVTECGLWDFSPQKHNFALWCDEKGMPHLTFMDLERPQFGGGNPLYFFHKNKDECSFNARVGLSNLMYMLSADEDDAFGDFGELNIVRMADVDELSCA
ncbi:hypothetical protein FJ366_03580 [Candidatus Dependentiae bacterium]|nr:hypothetical protein [Candidatus Dependentiae bacterium]